MLSSPFFIHVPSAVPTSVKSPVFQSALNTSSIFCFSSSALLVIPSNALFQRFSYSSTAFISASDNTPLTSSPFPFPLFPSAESFSFLEILLSSSNPINCLLNFFCASVALSIAPAVSFTSSSKLSQPLLSGAAMLLLSHLIPNKSPIHCTKSLIAIVIAFKYGSTALTIGINNFPIIIPVAFMLFLSILNWFAG